MKRKRFILTPILISIPLLAIALIMDLILSTWVPLYFLVMGAFLLESALMIFIDRLLLYRFKLELIWIIEMSFIILIFILKAYKGLDWTDMIFLMF